MGTRVYLSCTMSEELVNGHCLIVPIQHHLNMLEGDDDVWDETRVSFSNMLLTLIAYCLSLEFHEMFDEDVCRRG